MRERGGNGRSNVSAREAAIMQAQYCMIGNAVPPCLGEALACRFLEAALKGCYALDA
jgi:hypothetical protein